MKPYLLNILHPLVERISKEFTASKVKIEYFLLNLAKLVSKNNQHDVTCGLSFIFMGSHHSFSTCFELSGSSSSGDQEQNT